MHRYVDDLGSPSPTPGGGSAAAWAGAMGAALVSMACGLTTGKEKFASVQEEMQIALAEAQRLRQELIDLAGADTAAFDQVMAAYRLPRDTEEQKSERRAAVQTALREATRVPMETVLSCAGVVRLVTRVIDKINPSTLSDAGTAAMLAQAGLRGACLNVSINLASLDDDEYAAQTWRRVESEMAESNRAADEVFSHCLTRTA